MEPVHLVRLMGRCTPMRTEAHTILDTLLQMLRIRDYILTPQDLVPFTELQKWSSHLPFIRLRVSKLNAWQESQGWRLNCC